jgi:chemotaxis protein methyltransferase CheR
MALDRVTEDHWLQLSALVAQTMGLHFPGERRADFERGLTSAALELGFDDLAAFADRLLSAKPPEAQLQVLASHLTVGETYFFRDRKTLDVLADQVLPDLVRSRRGHDQRLRIWSAGCCTGEEPYTLAMLVHQLVPDLADWRVTILATDINAGFLRKAAAASYGEWSFRDAPAGVKERYFKKTGTGRYTVLPGIRQLVTFEHLNLVEDGYPSLATGTNAMDLIFCRNVTMYFTRSQSRKVIGHLHRALLDGGWLVVSPTEASHVQSPDFVTWNFPGAILFQKSDTRPRAEQPWVAAPHDAIVAPAIAATAPWSPEVPLAVPVQACVPPLEVPARAEAPAAVAAAQALYRQGRYGEAVDALLPSIDRQAIDPAAFPVLARALANLGRLADALAWCERWTGADKLDPAAHFLRAVVLLEMGNPDQARSSLRRAIYLHPDFVLAHFALGNIARNSGSTAQADKHFGTALDLLGRHQPAQVLPESEGLSAGRLTETITALSAWETTP